MAEQVLLTAEETAERLRCGRTYVFGLISSGQLDSVKVGRLRRIPAAAIAEYVDRLRGEQQRAAA